MFWILYLIWSFLLLFRRAHHLGVTRFKANPYMLLHCFATERLAVGVLPIFFAKTLGYFLSALLRTYENVMAETKELQWTLWSEMTSIELKEVGIQFRLLRLTLIS
jgi:hypothetical protein